MGSRILLSFTFVLFLCNITTAQTSARFWVIFRDKGPAADIRLKYPGNFLSSAALENRIRKRITADEKDLPVWEGYIQELCISGIGTRCVSRWLNAVSVETNFTPAEILRKVPDAKAVVPLHSMTPAKYSNMNSGKVNNDITGPENTDAYGLGKKQVNMMNVPYLHSLGFRGEGVKVAILDAGFAGVDTLTAFTHIWKSNRMLNWWDFVKSEKKVFEDDDHGLHVLSCIGANIPGELIGTGPGASFILGRTETVFSESRQEEDNWVKGMEWADSMGADVIHSSLGYNTFDNASENYTYDSIDGHTSLISKAATIASTRGILVTTSAGNEGFSPWHFITVPCDAEGVLCIGSVDSTGRQSYFSSVGPTFDGRIKPDVVAMGTSTAIIGTSGDAHRGDGTSYAAPLVAGLAACLIQAHPLRTNLEIIDAIRSSGNRHTHPGNRLGYGIPDARKADSLLTEMDSLFLVQHPGKIAPENHFRFERNWAEGKIIIRNLSSEFSISKIELRDENQNVVISLAPDANANFNSVQLSNKTTSLRFYVNGGRYFDYKLLLSDL